MRERERGREGMTKLRQSEWQNLGHCRVRPTDRRSEGAGPPSSIRTAVMVERERTNETREETSKIGLSQRGEKKLVAARPRAMHLTSIAPSLSRHSDGMVALFSLSRWL